MLDRIERGHEEDRHSDKKDVGEGPHSEVDHEIDAFLRDFFALCEHVEQIECAKEAREDEHAEHGQRSKEDEHGGHGGRDEFAEGVVRLGFKGV